jgi:hypothetical protein
MCLFPLDRWRSIRPEQRGSRGGLIVAITVLGPVAIVQLRKVLQALIAGRKIKLTNGTLKFEGSVKDLEALLTREQIQQLTERRPAKKRLGPRTSRARGSSE